MRSKEVLVVDFTTIIEFISTLGFPIACVIALFFYIYKIQQESVNREDRLLKIVEDYGVKLAEITATIDAINDKIDRCNMSK